MLGFELEFKYISSVDITVHQLGVHRISYPAGYPGRIVR